MSSSNMKTKQILQQLKMDNPDNVNTGRHVENVLQKIKREKMENLTPIHYFLRLLKDHDYYRYTRKELGTNSLGDVFFAHPTATDLMRLFGYVLVMDTTYKTNRFDLPLLEVVGVVPMGQNFHVAFAFIKNEKKDSFVWALQKLKTLFGTPAGPGVIVTDRDLVLMNAVQEVFPDSSHLLCRRHIAKDAEKKLVDLTKSKEYSKVFGHRWKKVVDSLTDDQFQTNLAQLEHTWKNLSALLTYLRMTWLEPHKERFVVAWTKYVLHFGAQTTNRVESAHSQLNRWLGTSTDSFHTMFPQIHELVELQLNQIKAEMERQRTVDLHATVFQLFRRLKGRVSHRAIQLMDEEWQSRYELGTCADDCGCMLRTSFGLPCTHEMVQLTTNCMAIDPLDVHVYWRILHMVGDVPQDETPRRSTADDLIDEAVAELRRQPERQKVMYAHMMHEMLHLETTELEEPQVRQNSSHITVKKRILLILLSLIGSTAQRSAETELDEERAVWLGAFRGESQPTGFCIADQIHEHFFRPRTWTTG
ncbi:hypothetical protein Dimus_038799 [Dionaea muscipula]